jgi:hypothetical protein
VTSRDDWRPAARGWRADAKAELLGAAVVSEVQTTSALLGVKAGVYHSELADAPTDHFRVGLGRLGLEPGLEAFDRFLRQR